MGPYSAPTTAVPYATAPTPATYHRPPNSTTDQPAFYTAPTVSAPYGSTASGLCKIVVDYHVLCPFDVSVLVPVLSSHRSTPPAPHIQKTSGLSDAVWIDSYFVRDDVKSCFHKFYFNHLWTKTSKFEECIYPTNDL